MKKVELPENAPQTWHEVYYYDLIEIYGEKRILGHTYAYQNRRRIVIDLIQKVAQPGAKILDVAAAQGNYSLLLAEMGYDVTWNDLRTDLIDYVKLKHEKGSIQFAPGNCFDLGFDSEFDIVIITEIIEHVAHPDDFLQKIAQLVKPGGYIVMTTPNGEYIRHNLPKFSDCPNPSQFEELQFQPNSDGHIFLLHEDEIRPLIEAAGLNLIEFKLYTNSLTNGHVKTEYLLKILPRFIVDSLEQFTETLPLSWQRKLHKGMAVLMQRPA
ncbi:MAG: methyltransferase domain-containing protein [Jaaginema sp. PMC 1079.18]|nr:methyltransferase domain-containing protein [Jaaginema sp. PMC 1080.18]MEC4850731.1 methyltransferase domain-containing protein [Jaaginema sp. PMC 1079.18]MEC4865281.1 methyltransferase domain-containing protein [Jaaginema sp. PMC 1078.18]